MSAPVVIPKKEVRKRPTESLRNTHMEHGTRTEAVGVLAWWSMEIWIALVSWLRYSAYSIIELNSKPGPEEGLLI